MQGTKRTSDEMEGITSTNTGPNIMSMFEGFKQEIDHNHAARERIIKAGRDVTALSKKAIFALQRAQKVQTYLPSKVAKEYQEKITAISELFNKMSADLQGINAWRYQRQASGGIQEFIEAVSFEHYLKTGKLITRDEAASGPLGDIPLTPDDYALGLFDLSGEMMRFAITKIATTGSLPAPAGSDTTSGGRSILRDLRNLKILFQALDTTSCGPVGLGRDFEKKMDVMSQSVEKVEISACKIMVRRQDKGEGWAPGLDTPMESY